MTTVFRNPVSCSIYALTALVVFLFVMLEIRESPLLVAQHLLVPYTVDITRGVGEPGARLFRAATLVLQLLVFTFIFLVTRSRPGTARVVLSVCGILLVVAYFLLVAFGYVMPRFH